MASTAAGRPGPGWLAEHGQRFRLHFLPPYCPDDNRIERCVWRDLHQNVTVNHQHQWIGSLMGDVAHYLFLHNCRAAYRYRARAASKARSELSELRPAI